MAAELVRLAKFLLILSLYNLTVVDYGLSNKKYLVLLPFFLL